MRSVYSIGVNFEKNPDIFGDAFHFVYKYIYKEFNE